MASSAVRFMTYNTCSSTSHSLSLSVMIKVISTEHEIIPHNTQKSHRVRLFDSDRACRGGLFRRNIHGQTERRWSAIAMNDTYRSIVDESELSKGRFDQRVYCPLTVHSTFYGAYVRGEPFSFITRPSYRLANVNVRLV